MVARWSRWLLSLAPFRRGGVEAAGATLACVGPYVEPKRARAAFRLNPSRLPSRSGPCWAELDSGGNIEVAVVRRHHRVAVPFRDEVPGGVIPAIRSKAAWLGRPGAGRTLLRWPRLPRRWPRRGPRLGPTSGRAHGGRPCRTGRGEEHAGVLLGTDLRSAHGACDLWCPAVDAVRALAVDRSEDDATHQIWADLGAPALDAKPSSRVPCTRTTLGPSIESNPPAPVR